MYNVQEQEDYVSALSPQMISNTNKAKLLEKVYPEALIDEIDIDDIRDFLSVFTLDRCKVVLLGKELLKDSCQVPLPEQIIRTNQIEENKPPFPL